MSKKTLDNLYEEVKEDILVEQTDVNDPLLILYEEASNISFCCPKKIMDVMMPLIRTKLENARLHGVQVDIPQQDFLMKNIAPLSKEEFDSNVKFLEKNLYTLASYIRAQTDKYVTSLKAKHPDNPQIAQVNFVIREFASGVIIQTQGLIPFDIPKWEFFYTKGLKFPKVQFITQGPLYDIWYKVTMDLFDSMP